MRGPAGTPSGDLEVNEDDILAILVCTHCVVCTTLYYSTWFIFYKHAHLLLVITEAALLAARLRNADPVLDSCRAAAAGPGKNAGNAAADFMWKGRAE
jgi:hypothetical protein